MTTGSPSNEMKTAKPATNEPRMVAVPSQWPQRSVNRPPSRRTAAPASGRPMISESTSIPSELQQVRVVDRGRTSGPEQGHDDRQAHDHLGRGHHHHEEG